MGSSASKPATDKNKTNNSGGDTKPKQASPSDTVNSQTPPRDVTLVKKDTGQSKTDENKSKQLSEKVAGKSDKTQEVEKKPDTKPEFFSAQQPKQDTENKVKPKDSEAEGEKEGETKERIKPEPNDSTTVDMKKAQITAPVEKVFDEGPKEQKMFDAALKSACLLVKQDSLMKRITKNVTKLQLSRALPLHFSLPTLLNKMENLKDLDLSNNKLGPQGFRAVCLAMCGNSTILSLNLSANMSDTDSADSLGKMLEKNTTLQYLDVSSNYLGKDYFCRKCGPPLTTNNSLKTLRCASIGTTDARLLVDALRENTCLTEFDFSNNYVADPVGFAKGLADNLKRADCVLTSLSLGRCDLKSAAVKELHEGLSMNQSMLELNLKGSEFGSLGALLEFVVMATTHPCLQTLCVDSCKLKSQDIKSDTAPTGSVSPIQVLSFNACGLNDTFFTSLEKCCKGRLLSLVEIDLTANEDLTSACMDCLANLTSDDDQASSLRRIKFGQLSKGDNFTAKLLEKKLPSLQYLNLRNCKLSTEAVGQIGQYLTVDGSCLSTVILDGLKLSKTGAVAALLQNTKSSQLSTLSISGSSLDDDDLSPLFQSIKSGLQLHMLKLSANRITDTGIASFVEAVLANKKYPLAVVDFSNNRIGDAGAETFTKLFTAKSHNSCLHSVNLSSNEIGKEGLILLMSAVGGKSPLQTLYVHGQGKSLDEPHMVEIFNRLAASLGYKVQMDGERIKPGCSDLPSNLPEGLMVKLTDLGGHTGSIGQALDSLTILTDFVEEKCPNLSFKHIMQICCFIKGIKAERCVWSEEDWKMIIGADKATTDTPSWLTVTEERDKCLYLSNLPGNTTQQKIDAMLEMEADCNLNEACLMKDPVTRAINGAGWVVMMDEESVQKAVEYFNSGEARVFGQPIMISEIKVQVDNEASADHEKKAVYDREERMRLRAKEDAAHRSLITRTAEESWKRHAYRLAHPAYADGRIW